MMWWLTQWQSFAKSSALWFEDKVDKLPKFYSDLRMETTHDANNDSGSGDDSEDSNYFVDNDNEVWTKEINDLYEEYIE